MTNILDEGKSYSLDQQGLRPEDKIDHRPHVIKLSKCNQIIEWIASQRTLTGG